MSSREWKIAIVGTFDVDNYGDLLFPLIAEAELAERLGEVKLHCFSYGTRTAAEWPFPVTSITELPRLAAGFDGILVGGGFIIRFDKNVAPGYFPPSPAIHHPTGYWLSPALIGLQHGVPVLWNTPGVNYGDLPSWADPLMELAFSLSSYIAVRDEPSRAALARFVDQDRISLVPDTAFGVGRRLDDRSAFELNRLRDALGLRGPYITLQGVGGLEGCQRFLKRYANHLRDYRFLALPVGPVNGDDAALLDADLPGLVRLTASPPPLLLAELIRHASAVIGPSYHLAVTALTAGVPVFSQSDLQAGKFPGLAEFPTIYPLPLEDDPDPSCFLSRLRKSPVLPQVCAAIDRLAVHWDRIAAVLDQGTTDSAVAVSRFWQSLPGLLESAAARHAEAAAAQRQAELQEHLAESSRRLLLSEEERSRGQERIAELSRLLALARSEIVTRDGRIAEFLESTSWKLSAPVRFVGRRVKQ
jgi:lipopolysaccharide transport system ATP-binding protein